MPSGEPLQVPRRRNLTRSDKCGYNEAWPMSPVDKTDSAIRFGCGFVVGLFVFAITFIGVFYDDPGPYIAIVLVSGVAFGLAALKFGDAFWHWFARWFTWFR